MLSGSVMLVSEVHLLKQTLANEMSEVQPLRSMLASDEQPLKATLVIRLTLLARTVDASNVVSAVALKSILVRAVQPSKHDEPSVVSPLQPFKLILVSEVQFWKLVPPIVVILVGSVMLSSEEQLAKHDTPNEVSEVHPLRSTLASTEQLAKQLLCSDARVEGSKTSASDEQLAKQFIGSVVIAVSERSILVRAEQP